MRETRGKRRWTWPKWAAAEDADDEVDPIISNMKALAVLRAPGAPNSLESSLTGLSSEILNQSRDDVVEVSAGVTAAGPFTRRPRIP